MGSGRLEVVTAQRTLVFQQDGLPDRMLKLADISGPGMCNQSRQKGGRNPLLRQIPLYTEMLQGCFHQRGNVVRPLA